MAESTATSKKYILVVDDEADVARYLGALLEDAGYEVAIAHDGDQALELVKERSPDLISLDLVMPAKSGTRFLYALRKNREWARIPVLIVTGHARDDIGRKDLEEILASKVISGPETYLEKPVSPSGYVAAVERQLGVAPGERASPAPDTRSELKGEIEKLLQSANAEQMREILDRLRRHDAGP
ncbi:MAG: response regulator [Planctomycetota bacterium]